MARYWMGFVFECVDAIFQSQKWDSYDAVGKQEISILTARVGESRSTEPHVSVLNVSPILFYWICNLKLFGLLIMFDVNNFNKMESRLTSYQNAVQESDSEIEICKMLKINVTVSVLLTHFSNPLHVNDTLASIESWAIISDDWTSLIRVCQPCQVSFVLYEQARWCRPGLTRWIMSEFMNGNDADYNAAQSSAVLSLWHFSFFSFITAEISCDSQTKKNSPAPMMSCRIRRSSE